MVAALAEALFSYFYFGDIDSFSLASIFLVFLMGVYPEPFIDKFEPTVTHFLNDILKIGAMK